MLVNDFYHVKGLGKFIGKGHIKENTQLYPQRHNSGVYSYSVS